MPYLGNVPAEAYTNTVKDSFNGDASTTAFTLSQPSTTNNLRVVVENVIQDPTVAYTVSGTTLTFTSAPPVGTANIYAVHLGPATQTAVPPAEINNATTYTSDLTVQGAFTSQGIDDNADATAITIDSSEIVMMGKTTAGFANVGQEFRPTAYSAFTRDGGTTALFNRKTSDGTIVEYMKDGTTVGSIASDSGSVMLGSGDVGVYFDAGSDRIIPMNMSTLSVRNDAIDIGGNPHRFKDLYLSGGVYLGGTGSANLLDDVETGSWTPVLSGNIGESGQSYNSQNGAYTKVGSLVYCSAWVNVTSIGTVSGSYAFLRGLPFTVANGNQNYGGGVIQYWDSFNVNSSGFTIYTEVGTTYCYVMYRSSFGATATYMPPSGWGTSPNLMFTITYRTDA